MKLSAALLVCLVAATLSAAEQKSSAKPPAKKSAPAAVAAPTSDALPAGVPANATLVEPGVWRAADEKGKVWLYKYSPFGLSKVSEAPDHPSTVSNMYTGTVSSSEKPSNVVAFIEGDTIRFEQLTPFGTRKWTRKSNDEMESDEKAAIERARQRGNTRNSAK